MTEGKKIVADSGRDREGGDGIVGEGIMEKLERCPEEFEKVEHEANIVKKA